MYSITQRFEFDSGHRVLGHTGKCRFLHGHRYTAEITISPIDDHLNDLGMVIDFGDVKKIIGTWIDEQWDHNMILHPDDPLLNEVEDPKGIIGRFPYIMPHDYPNPTAENLSKELWYKSHNLLVKYHMLKLNVEQVVLWETPNCRASFPAKVIQHETFRV